MELRRSSKETSAGIYRREKKITFMGDQKAHLQGLGRLRTLLSALFACF